MLNPRNSLARSPSLWVARTLLALTLVACDDGARQSAGDSPASAQDSAATQHEMRASVAGEVAPGAQSYSFRGLYAGLPQARIERRLHVAAGGAAAACHPLEKAPTDLACSYDSPLGVDSARVHVDAIYGPASDAGERVAREITVVRELPLDVDGVHLARQLADAFERQTALLDRRDASYGHHQAQIRMGTVNGARLNYVDVTVMPRAGREVLTVKMSRSGEAAAPKPAVKAPAKPAAKAPAPGKGGASPAHHKG
jgi:hypothetical protein